MGLLDGVLGSVMKAIGGGGAAGAGGNDLLGAVLGMVQQQGGLGGLVGMLKQAGLGEQVDSWVGTGANKAVGTDQLLGALGAGNVAKLAESLGMDQGQAGQALTKLLPDLIDRFTPDGKVPSNAADLLSEALGSLGRR